MEDAGRKKGWKEKKCDNKRVRREPNEGPALGTVRKSREGAGNPAHILR